MELNQEFRFICKLCNKKYPCGKSLGGHMRSHVIAMNDPTKLVAAAAAADFSNGQSISSYVLRENPRKTWRAVDAKFPLPHPQEKICKQCGKGFHSLKALCGHMACHSDRDRGLKEDHTWTIENPKLVMDSRHSDTESEDRILRTRSSFIKSKMYKKVASNNVVSCVSETDGEEEQEEVAMCLMLLSRDPSGSVVKGGIESSDNNSVILETKSSSIHMRSGKMEALKNVDNLEEEIPREKNINGVGEAEMENSDSGYFLDDNRNTTYIPCVFETRNNRRYVSEDKELYDEYCPSMMHDAAVPGDDDDDERCKVSVKRSKYECFNCKKSFKSYQALGGHRPCHKRSNAYDESRYERGENSLDNSAEFVTCNGNAKKNKSKKNKCHACPFCTRVFKNGQALGGHKRSHFLGGHEGNSNRSLVVKPDLLDLNLPAPEDDEDYRNDPFSGW